MIGKKTILPAIVCSLPCLPAYSQTYDDCLLQQLKQGDNSLNLSTIREHCAAGNDSEQTPLDHRAQEEKKVLNNRFVITPHRPNYFLPLSYNSKPNNAPFEQHLPDSLTNTEIKFQLSVKAPLVRGLMDGLADIFVAYTNTSWWQAYNKNSAPFRETNHEPELFIFFPTDYRILSFDLNGIATGVSHQSNGRGGELSRSWNRLYVQFILSRDNLTLSFKPWWRLPEPDKAPGSARGDDNPDIKHYMGHGELQMNYQLQSHNLGVTLRNNLKHDNKGAVQLEWSFPINARFRGYLQYFNGYGESLIDYNAHTNRLSMGIMLTDWL